MLFCYSFHCKYEPFLDTNGKYKKNKKIHICNIKCIYEIKNIIVRTKKINLKSILYSRSIDEISVGIIQTFDVDLFYILRICRLKLMKTLLI